MKNPYGLELSMTVWAYWRSSEPDGFITKITERHATISDRSGQSIDVKIQHVGAWKQ
jgi:hypothetical protein